MQFCFRKILLNEISGASDLWSFTLKGKNYNPVSLSLFSSLNFPVRLEITRLSIIQMPSAKIKRPYLLYNNPATRHMSQVFLVGSFHIIEEVSVAIFGNANQCWNKIRKWCTSSQYSSSDWRLIHNTVNKTIDQAPALDQSLPLAKFMYSNSSKFVTTIW